MFKTDAFDDNTGWDEQNPPYSGKPCLRETLAIVLLRVLGFFISSPFSENSKKTTLTREHFQLWPTTRHLKIIRKQWFYTLQTELNKCSLLARHFDPLGASITSGLLQFLSRPFEQLHTVCKKIYSEHTSCVLQQFEQDLSRFLKGLPLFVLNGLESLYLEV